MQQLPALVFATRNTHKVEEVRHALGSTFRLMTLTEAGIDQDIPEPYPTLEENAREKTRVIYGLTGCDCFSEDSGLEVLHLSGQPGVRSARYAGEPPDDAANIRLLLANMSGITDRKARFRTIVSLVIEGAAYLFEGTCEGRIAASPAGTQGFGYDPIFIPDGAGQTFAEMGMAAKNAYSHRRKAMEKMVEFLQSLQAGESRNPAR